MGVLFQILSINRHAESYFDTRAEQDLIRQSRNTSVVYFRLSKRSHISRNVFNRQNAGATFAKDVGSRRYLLATSNPTALEPLESHVALAPASTSELTL